MTTHPYVRLFPKLVAPTVSDDNTLGYEVGDLWEDTAHSKSYQAFSVSTGAASWIELTAGAGGGLPTPFALVNDITPTTIATSQQDYNPTGLSTADIVRVSSSADVIIRGLVGGADGRILMIMNVGTTYIITLTDEDPSNPTAGNRFHFSETAGNDFGLQPSRSVVLYYDATISRWRQYADRDAGTLQGVPIAQNLKGTTHDQYALIYDSFLDAVVNDVQLDHDVAIANAGSTTHAQIDTFISTTAPATYAPITKGVTNGDSHDHNGGDGAQIAYSTLSGTPTLKQVAFMHGGNNTIGAGATQSLVMGLSGFQSAINAIMPVACTFKNLSIRLNGTQPASGSLVATLLVNNVASTLVVTIAAGSGAGSYADSTHTVSISANDLFRIDIKNNASGASGNLTGISFEINY